MTNEEKKSFKGKLNLICAQALLLSKDMVDDDSVNDLNEYQLLIGCLHYLEEANKELEEELEKEMGDKND